MRVLVATVAGFAVVVVAACVEKGSARVTSAFADLTPYEACSLDIREAGLLNPPRTKQYLTERIRSDLSAAGVCEVKPDGELLLKIHGKFDQVLDIGMGGSNIEGKDYLAELDVDLVEAKSGKALGSFHVTGNTKASVRTLGDQVDDISGAKEKVALANASAQITKTLIDRRGGGRPMKRAPEPDAGPMPILAASSTPSTPSTPSVPSTPAPAPVSAPPAALVAGCALVCNVANKGRMSTADEQRFTSALGGEVQALHACGRGRVPGLTLRFGSDQALTWFGLDGEEGDACFNTIREHHPAVTYPGPATVRCVEKCGR